MRSGRRLSKRRHWRAALVVAAGVAALVAGAGFGTPALRPLGVTLLVIGAVAIGVVELAARGLRIERTLDRDTIVAGEPIRATIRLTGWAARSGLIHMLDWDVHAGAPRGTAERPLAAARRGGDVVQPVVLAGLPRGEHVLGPPWVGLGDPFGLVRVRRAVRSSSSVLALAATVPVGLPFWEGATRRTGDNVGRVRGRVELGGIRDYEPGDPLSLIHWTQTARRGRLQTKELHGESGRGRRLLVVLDAHTPAPGSEALAAFETAVSAAASLVAGCAARGSGVGLEHAADPAANWPVGSPEPGMERSLALVRPNGREPISALLRSIATRSDAPDTVVVVSSHDDRLLSGAAAAARGAGVNVAAVLVGPARGSAQALRRTGAVVAEVADRDHLATSLDLMAVRA